MSTIRRFVPFAKVEKQDDGTLLVEGVASSETRDSDGEIITADAMRKAIPGFLRADGTGPVREMHALKAAGKTVEVWVDKENKTRVSAVVVDSEACKKVETGVYQGFSVGGKATARSAEDPSVITELKWVELSLVDRGANPDAVISLWKAEAMPETKPQRPFVQLAALVEKFKKGDVQLDDAEKRALDITKAALPPAPAPTVIRKGMYQVSRAAELMDGLCALQESLKWESEYEGDASPVPAMFGDCMRTFAGAMKALLDEELSEALGGEDAEKVAGAADKAGSLSKAAGDAARKLAEIVKQMKPAPKAAAAAAPPPPAAATKEPAVPTDPKPAPPAAAPQSEVEKALARVKEELDAKLAKAQAEREAAATAQSAGHEALKKSLELQEQIRKQKADDDAQAKQLADAVAELSKKYDAEIQKVTKETEQFREIAAQATAQAQKTNALAEQLVQELAKRPKGALSAVPISKAADNGTEPTKAEPVDPKDPVALVKAVHANGPSIDLTARLVASRPAD